MMELKNGTHNKIRLIFGYIELLVAAPNGKLQKMMGTLKSWWISLFHLLDSWPMEGDFPSVKTVSWEVIEAHWEPALTAFGH